MSEATPAAVEKKEGMETSKVEEATKDKNGDSTEKEVASKDAVEAFNLLAQGKRNVLCGEIPQAVNQLQEACRLLAAKFGETGDQLGDAYMCYGSALLDLSRMESGVLGNALQGIDDEESESGTSDDKVEDPEKTTGEEREKISEEVIDAMTERADEKTLKKKESNGEAKEDGEKKDKAEKTEAVDEKKEAMDVDSKATDDKEKGKDTKDDKAKKEEKTDDKADEKEGKKKDDEESEGKEDETEEDEEAESEDIGEEDAETKSQEGETKEGEAAEETKKEDEEDVSNLQLAWEMLELAKVIFSRTETKEMKLKTAEAYLKLGEVGMETEQYDQAVQDLQRCLKIRKELLDAESRLIAETYYQIGLACCFSAQYDESISNLKNAVNVIEAKISQLNKVIEAAEKTGKGKEPASFDDPLVVAQKELKDLKEILPDILAKIEDTEDERKSQDQVKKLVKENVVTELGTTTGFGEAATTEVKKTSQTSDISHLVRKKRKPEDEAEADDETSKKPRQEMNGSKPISNGSGDATELNGKATSPDKNGVPKIKVKTVEDVKKAGEAMESTPKVST